MDHEPTDKELSDLLASMPSLPVEKIYDAAIFFDNDTNNFYEADKGVCEVCPEDDKMRCIPINETKNIQKCKWDEEPLKSYIKQFGNENIYLNALRILYDSDKFDVVSGIQDNEFYILNDWIEETESLGDRRAAIFDWDRTGVYDSTGKKVRPQRRCSPKEHFVKQTYPIPYANHLYYDSPEECARHFNTKQHVSINLNPELVKSWHEMKKEFANPNPNLNLNTSDE